MKKIGTGGKTSIKQWKKNRFRVVVQNDSQEGGEVFNPPFKSKNEFVIKEFSVEYENRNYISYLITETPDEYKNVFDTRVFYQNNSNSYGRTSNLFTIGCEELIMDMLNRGDFEITFIEGYKKLILKNDPLDLNNFIAKEDYDFVYEVVNNTSGNLVFANIITDEKSQILTLSNDFEIESGQIFQFKYDLKTLKKIYGPESKIGIDLKKSEEKQWIRGWENDYDHHYEKHTVVISDGTQGRLIDTFDLWTDFPLQSISQRP